MQERVKRYLHEQLASTGFALLSWKQAFNLRRDIWDSACVHGVHFAAAMTQMDAFFNRMGGICIREIQTIEDGSMLVATRSDDMLAQRIGWITGWITGLSVVAIKPRERVHIFVQAASPVRFDNDDIPSWPCVERTEKLKARGLAETTFESRHFGPKPSPRDVADGKQEG